MWAWAGVALALSLVLCFVPLFDLLGYELALAVTVFAGVCARIVPNTAFCAALVEVR